MLKMVVKMLQTGENEELIYPPRQLLKLEAIPILLAIRIIFFTSF